jgi:hypothetical protein
MSLPIHVPFTKVARISKKIAIGLVAFVLLIVLVCFAINSFDVPLSAEAKTLLAAPSNPYRSDDNIYVALAGFDGPSQQSVIDIGRARIAAYNQALASMPLKPDAALAFSKRSESKKLTFNGDLTSWQPLTSSIWTAAKSHRADIAGLLASNQELYQRYLALHRLPGYYDTARLGYFMPLIYVPQPVRALFLADVANRIQTGTLQQQRAAIDELSQDLRMWRVILKGNGDLSSKMIAAASLHADFLLLADMIADPNIDSALLAGNQRAVLSPFDLVDWKIGNVFGAELANSPVADSSARPSGWWERQWNIFGAHFFKLNATENLRAAQMTQLSALADADPARFSRSREAYRGWLNRNVSLLSPTGLYNPVGKLLVRIAADTYEDYPMRVFDVAAFQRLVYLAFQLRLQCVGTSDVASFLKQHPEWSAHPIDGKPFRWNPATGELAVNTVGTHPYGRRFSVIFRQ